MNRIALSVCLSLCWASILLVAGCGRDKPPGVSDAQAGADILLIGVDGLEWDVLLPLVRDGKAPAIAALMRRGVFGKLKTIRPTLSPVIWTTIATGKMPDQHGINNFVKPALMDGKPQLFSNRDRKTKAIWNIASDYDQRVAVVGWWMTYPVEPINGVMVAQTNTAQQLDIAGGKQIWKGRLIQGAAGQVYPPERQDSIMGLARETEGSLPLLTEAIFGKFEHPLSELGRRLWDNCLWSFRADAVYVRVAESLLSEAERFDLLAVYLGGTDVVGHRFWRYMEPGLYAHPPTEAQVANFGKVIENYYLYVDEVIGRLVSAAGPDARIIVCSDHGMKPVNTQGRFDPDDPPSNVNSAHHTNGEPGVIILAGLGLGRSKINRDVEKLQVYDLPTLGSVLEITPTVLALLSIPIGRDMSGSVNPRWVSADFLAGRPFRTVPTHDSVEWLTAHRSRTGQVPGADQRIEQLKDLGYIGGGE
ncbi:MAG: alkaline phosphatase family protein [Phycisphaerae bacterium]